MPWSSTESFWQIFVKQRDAKLLMPGIEIVRRATVDGMRWALVCLPHGHTYAQVPMLDADSPGDDQARKMLIQAREEHTWMFQVRYAQAMFKIRDGVCDKIRREGTVVVDEHAIGWPRASAVWHKGFDQIHVVVGVGCDQVPQVNDGVFKFPPSQWSLVDTESAEQFVAAQAFVAHVRMILSTAFAVSGNAVIDDVRRRVARSQGGLHVDPWRMPFHEAVECLCAMYFLKANVMPPDAEFTWIRFLDGKE